MSFKDPRASNYKEKVAEFRKVAPVDLDTDQANRASKTSKSRNIKAGIERYTGSWNKDTAAHLLRRTVFALLPSDLSTIESLGMNSAVDQLLTESPVPDLPINDYNNFQGQGYEDPTVPFGETWVNAIYDNDAEGYRITSLKAWVIGNMVKQEMNLHEKMKLFWHNLLVTQSWDVFISKASFQYFDLLHKMAFGNYKDFIRAITLDPSMLIFLNGAFNRKDAPDENYGRELQELFCVGKGPDSKYTEEDVRAASRVLTGWTLRNEDFVTEGPINEVFHSPFHDTSDKQFSSFYGNRVIEGKQGEAGAQELDELIDMLFDNEETAKYICRRLYTFFVYHEIDASVESNIITPLADIFRAENYEIKPVLEVLFKSAHFYDQAQFGAMIQSPAEFQVSILRSLNYNYPSSDNQTKLYAHLTSHWYMSSLGMEIGDPPSVAGWPAYYQAPQFDKSWITADSIAKRAEISDALTVWGLYLNDESFIPVDLVSCVKTLNTPEDPNELIQEFSDLFYGISLVEDIRDELKLVLLSGQTSDYYWTNAWNEYMEDESNSEKRVIVENRLRVLLRTMLQYAEFQLI